MMKQTANLRFIKRQVDKDVYRILQQQWIDDDPPDEGAIRYAWRDVPTAEEQDAQVDSGREEDDRRFEFLEQWARKSHTGISFDWIPSVEGEKPGFRFMRYHDIGEPKKTIREAIDEAALALRPERSGERGA